MRISVAFSVIVDVDVEEMLARLPLQMYRRAIRRSRRQPLSHDQAVKPLIAVQRLISKRRRR